MLYFLLPKFRYSLSLICLVIIILSAKNQDDRAVIVAQNGLLALEEQNKIAADFYFLSLSFEENKT